MENTKNKNYALPIAMMFALFFMVSFVTNLPGPLGVIIKNQFGVSNLLSSLGNAANFFAYAFMGIPAGMLLKKVGYKKTALLAITVGFIGVFIQYISGQLGSFPIYLTGAFVCGFSMCMLNTVVNPMLNTLGGGGSKGNQLLQLGGSINSLGATIVPVLLGYLMGNVASATIEKTTPALFLAMGIFAVAFIVLSFVSIPEPHIQTKAAATVKEKYSPLSFRHFRLGAIAIFVYVGVEIGMPLMANLFMTSSPENGGVGIDPVIAGSVIGTYWFLMLIGRLMGGIVGNKLPSNSMLAIANGLGMIFALCAIFLPTNITVDMPVFMKDLSFGMANVPINVMFIVLCGLCTSVMWGSIFNLAVEGLGKFTAAGSGFFMVMVCGGGIVPLIQGHFADLFGYIASYWVMFICLAYMFYFALLGCKNVNKEIPVLDEQERNY